MPLKSYVEQYASSFHLTEREKEVFQQLVNRVVSPADIGKKLNISLYTVNNHLKKILEKTNTDSKTELLADFLLYFERQKPKSELPQVKPRALILDDEADLTTMLQNFFQLRSIESHCFNCPEAALDAIRKLKVDVVVTDIRMPKLNGVHFLKELRKLHFYEPGVIFISGYPDEFEMETLLDLGAVAFLEKPVDLEKLHRLVWEYTYGSVPSPAGTDTPVTVHIGNIELTPQQIGFGGFFLSESQLAKHSKVHLAVGEKIEVIFQLSTSKHRAICEVVWMRQQENRDPGYGLKFIEISPAAKEEVLEHVRAHNILSFIPKGTAV